MSTLMEAGYSTFELGLDNVTTIANFLEASWVEEGETVGFGKDLSALLYSF